MAEESDHDSDIGEVEDDSESMDESAEPAETDGSVEAPNKSETPSSNEDEEVAKPQVEILWTNFWSLLRESSEVLPFVFVGVTILWMIPVMIKLIMGFDLLNLWDAPVWLLLVSAAFQCLAVILIAASMPIARDYLIGDGEPQNEFGAAVDSLFDNMPAAFPAAVFFSIIVSAGLLACVLPGIFAALYLAPTLYLVTAGNQSLGKAILAGPRQISGYSNLFAVILVTGLSFYFCLSILAGITLAPSSVGIVIVSHLDFATLLNSPVFAVAFALAAILVTAFNYCLYIAMAAAFITIDAHENDLPTG